MERVFYIRSLVQRGTIGDDEAGFMPDPDSSELYVNSLLSVDSANLASWKRILSGAGKAFYEAFRGKDDSRDRRSVSKQTP